MLQNLSLTHSKQGASETLSAWLLQQGLEGASQLDILQGYCEHLVDLGVPLMRVHIAQRAFHPQFGGLGSDWTRDSGISYEQYEHSCDDCDRAPSTHRSAQFNSQHDAPQFGRRPRCRRPCLTHRD